MLLAATMETILAPYTGLGLLGLGVGAGIMEKGFQGTLTPQLAAVDKFKMFFLRDSTEQGHHLCAVGRLWRWAFDCLRGVYLVTKCNIGS